MDANTIQEFANANRLDVREIKEYHLRLMDEWGKYILDVYISHKKGRIVRNATLQWKTGKWHRPRTTAELKKLL